MRLNLLDRIISNNKIHLSNSEKLRYYRTPIVLMIIAILCLANGEYNSNLTFMDLENNMFGKLGLFLLIITLIIIYFMNYKLKVKSIALNQSKEKTKEEVIDFIRNKKEWTIIEKSENLIIVATLGHEENNWFRRDFISPSMGEKIIIGFKNDLVYLKSIYDLNKNKNMIVDFGDNKHNERLIEKLITSAANKGYN